MATKQQYTKEELSAALKAGDKKAFEYLYDNYSVAIYGILNRIVKDNEVAGDLLQDTFVKIWKKIDSFDQSKGNLFTWMLNIARNSAIDKLRSKHFKYEIQNIEENVYAVDKKNNIIQNIDTLLLKEKVATLKTEQKEIIELAYFGGYTQEEIAEKLGMPLGTVKTRSRAALKELRKIFN